MDKARRKRIVQVLEAALVGICILAMAGTAAWYWMFFRPYCVRVDCRGRGFDVETVKQWEKQGEQGAFGMERAAGWRIEKQQSICSVSTSRRQRAKIICVYGAMDLAEPGDILSGRYGLAMGEDYCVLSGDLARNLFGSVQVAGEWVKIGTEKMMVAGVVDKEGDFLMRPVTEGRVEQVAVEFQGWLGAASKAKELMGE